MKKPNLFGLILAVLFCFVLNLFGCSEELPTPVTGGDQIINNFVPDSDGDGWTPLTDAQLTELGVAELALKKGDCDDTDAKVYPGAPWLIDGKDNDCDEQLELGECDIKLPCDDGKACTTGDKCVSGKCEGTVACDDSSACTTDSCGPGGDCVYQEVVFCDDQNPCTDEICDPATGGCVATNNTLDCDDGDVCTAGDVCKDGVCSAGVPLVCDDQNICNGVETCDPVTGCVLGEPLVCNDMDVCTTDSCDPLAGCQYAVVPCDDQNLCTNDSCDVVTGCAYAQKDCDDGKECTADLCDPATGECKNLVDEGAACADDGDKCTTDICDAAGECVHNALVCNNNDVCDGVETCDPATGCVLGVALACDDNNFCTDDSCDPATGCKYVANINQCTDDDVCTDGDVCTAGECVPGPALDCDDGDACTDDVCDPVTGCGNTSIPDCCYNDNMCEAPEGFPTEGYLWGCSEEDGTAGECTSCEEKDGDLVCAKYESLCDDGWDGDADLLVDCDDGDCGGKTCNDDDACTENDACAGGECAGTVVDCDDGDSCTTDSCDPVNGCQHAPVVCNDANACTDDSCDPATGGCVFAAVSCDDQNLCTDDSCDPVTGCKHTPLACNDNNLCTTDTCDPAAGCAFAPVSCDDNDQCTTDSCVPATGCAHAILPGCCASDDDCGASEVCWLKECVVLAPGACAPFGIIATALSPLQWWGGLGFLGLTSASGPPTMDESWAEACSVVVYGSPAVCQCVTHFGTSDCGSMPASPGQIGCWHNKKP